MIDIEKTLSLRGYDPLMLSYGSGKKVWAICNICGHGRWLNFQLYTDLCHLCSKRNSEAREIARSKAIEQWSDPEARKHQSKRKIRYHIDNPEAGKSHSERMKQFYIDNPDFYEEKAIFWREYWADQNNRNIMSEIKNDSIATKDASENMRGGNDIVNHHFIYDQNDLSLNTVQMTRSDHTSLHNLLRKIGYMVPHISTKRFIRFEVKVMVWVNY